MSRRPLRRLLPLLLLVLAVTATACSSAPPVSRSSEQRTVTISVDGRQRSYLLEPAIDLPASKSAALVVVLHQEGGTSESIAIETDLQQLRRKGATLVYPAGVDNSWDAGKCCGEPKEQGVDDVKFLDALFANVRTQTPVDTSREALVGYSSGGMLTYRYLCGRPVHLAVAVVVSGSLESECKSDITLPQTLALHGKLDGTIGFTKPIFVRKLGLAPRTVLSSLDQLTRSGGCAAPSTVNEPGVEVKRWNGCRGGGVEAMLIPGAGHKWGKLGATDRTRDYLVSHLLS